MKEQSLECDVLCVGHACFDLVLTMDHHLGPDEKGYATDFSESGGGPASTAALAIAKLGLSTAFAGYLGNDHYGDWHLDELATGGVNTNLIIRGKQPTPFSVVFVKPGGQRSVVNYRGQTHPLVAEDLDLTDISAHVILFDGHEPNISIPLARDAKSKRIPMVLDAGSVHRGTSELIHDVTYCVASEKFARQYTEETDVEKALEILADIVPNAVITLGDRGLIWKTPYSQGSIEAFPVNVVDTNGAGDAFHGAFAAGLVLGYEWEYLLQFSSAVAALNCMHKGGRAGLPGIETVQRFIKSIK